MVPTPELRDQFTEVLPVFKTVAVNCWVWAAGTVATPGVTETITPGFKVTVELAPLLVSAALVAVTVIVCVAVIFDGAVYRPLLEIVPVAGLRDHVTEVLLVLLTVAANCWV